MRDVIRVLQESAKAIVAFFAAPLAYIGAQLAVGKPIDWRVLSSLCITAVLVWAVPNKAKVLRRGD